MKIQLNATTMAWVDRKGTAVTSSAGSCPGAMVHVVTNGMLHELGDTAMLSSSSTQTNEDAIN